MPREFCLALSAASKQDNFASDFVNGRVMELLSMSPYSDLAYVRSWLSNLFVDGTLPVSLSDWQSYDFNKSVIERRSHFFFRGLANDRAHFRALNYAARLTPLCANDDETPAPFEFRLGHRRMTSWLCPTQMAQSN